MTDWGIWIVVIPCMLISAGCLVMSQVIYWWDLSKSKLWFDGHLEREGQPVPERRGFWWWLFLRLHSRFAK